MRITKHNIAEAVKSASIWLDDQTITVEFAGKYITIAIDGVETIKTASHEVAYTYLIGFIRGIDCFRGESLFRLCRMDVAEQLPRGIELSAEQWRMVQKGIESGLGECYSIVINAAIEEALDV